MRRRAQEETNGKLVPLVWTLAGAEGETNETG